MKNRKHISFRSKSVVALVLKPVSEIRDLLKFIGSKAWSFDMMIRIPHDQDTALPLGP